MVFGSNWGIDLEKALTEEVVGSLVVKSDRVVENAEGGM